MRIYKTREQFTKIQNSELSPPLYGSICTITDESDHPSYLYNGTTWDAFVTSNVDPVTGEIVFSGYGAAIPTRQKSSVLLVGDSFMQANDYFWYGGSITSMVRSSNVVTVTITSHSLASKRSVRVVNVPEAGFDGIHEITYTGANTFTFPSVGPDGSATVTSASVIVQDWPSFAGPFLWANMYLGGSLQARNIAVGGTTSTQVLAALQTALEADAEEGEVWIVCGYNDISASGFTSQTTVDNITAMVALCGQHNKVVRVGTMAPLGTASAKWGTTATLWVNTVNAAIRVLPTVFQNCYVADAYPALVDSTNTSNPGVARSGALQTDGVHPSVRGAQEYGKAFRNTFAVTPSRAGILSYADYSASAGGRSVVDSAPWVTSGGTAGTGTSGTVGGSITVERTSGTGTAVCSVVQPSIGGNAQRAVITSTDATQINMRSNNGATLAARLTAGERRRLCAYVSVAGVALPNFRDIVVEWFFTVDGVTYYYTIGTTAVVNYEPDEDFSGILVGPEIEVPAGAITNTGWRAQIRTGGASGSALTVDVGLVGFINF